MGTTARHRRGRSNRQGVGRGEGQGRGCGRPPLYAVSRSAFARGSFLALAVLGTFTVQRAVEAQDGMAFADEPVKVAAATVGRGVVGAEEVVGGRAPVEPWISVAMPKSSRDKLVTAFTLAVARVQEVEECRGLFAGLGADPVQALSTTLYYPAGPYKETTTCRRALAFTSVGAAPTRLCRRFAFLSDDEAAMVVVHEALHHAGLTERPADPAAMSAGAINVMVRRACGF